MVHQLWGCRHREKECDRQQLGRLFLSMEPRNQYARRTGAVDFWYRAPYTMTVIGVDGTLYGIQMGRMFALGETPKLSISDVTLTEETTARSMPRSRSI